MIFSLCQSIRLEIKCLGRNFFIPPLVIGLVFALFFLLASLGSSQGFAFSLFSEVLLAPIACWYPILLLQPIVEFSGGEIFYTFPTRPSHAVMRLLRAQLFIICLLAIAYVGLGVYMQQSLINIFLKTLMQTFFFAGLSFLAIVLTRSASISFLIIICYLLIGVTAGKYVPRWINIILLEEKVMPTNELLSDFIPRTILQTLALWILSQDVLRNTAKWK